MDEMGCCGEKKKTVKRPRPFTDPVQHTRPMEKLKHITVGYTNLIIGRKYEFTDQRVRICQHCLYSYWLGRTLWCKVCKCFIPAKARVENEKCPKGKW